MKIFSFSTLLLAFLSVSSFSKDNGSTVDPQQVLGKTSKTCLIENKGQWDAQLKFLPKTHGMNAWITDSGMVFDLTALRTI